MRLSRTVAYAIRAVVHIASQKPDQFINGHRLATTLDMPKGFLLRILVMLSRAGVLSAIKGSTGGYRLARPAKDITLLDVVEGIDGPLLSRVGFLSEKTIPLEERLKAIFEETTEGARRHLRKYTIADLRK